MTEGNYLDQKPRSPSSLLVVVAAHAAALTALALAKMDVVTFVPPKPIDVFQIPIQPDPPPIPEPIEKPQPQPKSVITAPTPEVPLRPVTDNPVTPSPPLAEPGISLTANGTSDIPRVQPQPLPPPPPLPKADPVRTRPQLKAGIELLPPYPASEERAGSEGVVVVRLVIGADGRVKAVERVSAASEAFWRATERHALRSWRFTPATVDGKPVESTHTMSVKFELRG